MIDFILWLPLTIYRLIQAWLFPRTLFCYTYEPSSEAERDRSTYATNQLRLAEYKVKRALYHND